MHMKLRSVACVATLAALMGVASGCGTIVNHVCRPDTSEAYAPDGKLYGGLRWDLLPFRYGDQTGGGILILDAPVSFVGDTLMLPYDLCRSHDSTQEGCDCTANRPLLEASMGGRQSY